MTGLGRAGSGFGGSNERFALIETWRVGYSPIVILDITTPRSTLVGASNSGIDDADGRGLAPVGAAADSEDLYAETMLRGHSDDLGTDGGFEDVITDTRLQLQAGTDQWVSIAFELTHPDHRHQLRYSYHDAVSGNDPSKGGDGVMTVTRDIVFWCQLERDDE